MKHIPQRTCIGCKVKKDKSEFIRIVCNSEGIISVDKNKSLINQAVKKYDKNEKKQGRGAYICNKRECLEKAIKSKSLEKSFKMKIDKDIYDNLRGVILE